MAHLAGLSYRELLLLRDRVSLLSLPLTCQTPVPVFGRYGFERVTPKVHTDGRLTPMIK